MPSSISFGLLLIRLGFGLTLAMHGLPKLLHFSDFAAKQGSVLLAVCAIAGELGGGLGLAVGLLTRLAGAGLAAVMWFVAFKVQGALQHLGQVGTGDGTKWEYPLLAGLVGFAFVVMGAGEYSLDEKLFPTKKKPRRIF